MAQMDTKKTEVVQPEGNYYDKYHSTNPIVKWMMKGFKNDISELMNVAGKKFCQICETGCGEGEISSFIKEMYQNAEIDAFDISERVIAEANALTFILGIFIQWRLESQEKMKNTF